MKKSKMTAMRANFLHPVGLHKKSVNISEPIAWIDFIFSGTNVALHRALNIFSRNFEKIQEGCYAGQFSLYI